MLEVKVLVNEDEKFKYYISKLSKEEYEQLSKKVDLEFSTYNTNTFKDEFNITPDSILMFGESKLSEEDVKTNYVKKVLSLLIPNKQLVVNNKSSKVYKCFALGLEFNELNNHLDLHSAWNCLIETLHRPKYVIVYKEFKNK